MRARENSISLFYHLFYEEGLNTLLEALNNLTAYNPAIFINISNDNLQKQNMSDVIKKKHPEAFIIFSTNKGKDIGAKLALIDLSIKLDITSKYSIFLHDKKSPHTTMGDVWRKKLFRIIEEEHIPPIFNSFEKNKKLGIVSAKEFISNEYDEGSDTFTCSSNAILKQLIKSHSLQLTNYDFVGGTMFWIRTEILTSFFKNHSPLLIRHDLEEGNVLDHENGTNTHAWERMLSWISTEKGYYIQGI